MFFGTVEIGASKPPQAARASCLLPQANAPGSSGGLSHDLGHLEPFRSLGREEVVRPPPNLAPLYLDGDPGDAQAYGERTKRGGFRFRSAET